MADNLISIQTVNAGKVLKRLDKNYARMFEQNQDKAGKIVLKAVQSEAPKKTGALVKGLKVKRKGKFGQEITSGTIQGNIIRQGSPPHPIFPSKKKALFWPGLPHPIPYVLRHPGFPANDYVKRGVENSRGEVQSLLGQFGEAIIA